MNVLELSLSTAKTEATVFCVIRAILDTSKAYGNSALVADFTLNHGRIDGTIISRSAYLRM